LVQVLITYWTRTANQAASSGDDANSDRGVPDVGAAASAASSSRRAASDVAGSGGLVDPLLENAGSEQQHCGDPQRPGADRERRTRLANSQPPAAGPAAAVADDRLAITRAHRSIG
jgi:hypothetical protein